MLFAKVGFVSIFDAKAAKSGEEDF